MRSNVTPSRRAACLSITMRLGVAAFAAAVGMACEKPAPPPAPPPPEVYVTDVVQRDVPVYLDLIGQTQGYQDVDIRARVEGFLETVNFQEGTFVSKGALLYQIDRKPFEAALAGARADLATAEARLEKANNDVNRYRPLVVKQAVSQQELDNAVAAQNAATSQVEAAKAAVEKATIDLGYTRIDSPIAGLVGTTQVKPGNLVGRGEPTLLTTISQIDPIILRVGVTEADYLRLVKRRQSAQAAGAKDLEVDAHARRRDAVSAQGPAWARSNAPSIRRPARSASSSSFRIPVPCSGPASTGARGSLLDVKTGALLVPQRAVQELQNLYSVAVVGRRQQGRVPQREGRHAGRQPLGHRRRPQARASGSSSRACSACRTA